MRTPTIEAIKKNTARRNMVGNIAKIILLLSMLFCAGSVGHLIYKYVKGLVIP